MRYSLSSSSVWPELDELVANFSSVVPKVAAPAQLADTRAVRISADESERAVEVNDRVRAPLAIAAIGFVAYWSTLRVPISADANRHPLATSMACAG